MIALFKSLARTEHPMRTCFARLPRSLFMASVLTAGSANATLIGDTVQGFLSDQGGGVVDPQFNPSAIVGPGVEFNGTWSYAPLKQIWNVAVDLDASTFTVFFNDVGTGPTHDISGFTFLGLALSDLDLEGPIIGVTVLSSDAAVQSIGFTDHGITVQWNAFMFRDANGNPLSSGSSTFGILTAPVPEPSSFAMLGLGLLVVSMARKRGLSSRTR